MNVQLDTADEQYVLGLLSSAQEPWPTHWQAWYLRGIKEPLGLLAPERAQALSVAMPAHLPLVQTEQGWVWCAEAASCDERSEVLQNLAHDLYRKEHITGWRHEAYACWGWLDTPWPYAHPELFRLERAAFRYFGLRSHAAHVHGITPDGRMWCGRRALNKATDPGLLDNLAVGGLPADEQPLQCALREVWEEAGLVQSVNDFSSQAQVVLTERPVAEGWHSERIFVYTLPLTHAQHPSNRDGEVSEFLCLSVTEVMHRIRSGEFTPDAACAIAITLARSLAPHAVCKS